MKTVNRCIGTMNQVAWMWWLGCALWLATAAFMVTHTGRVDAQDAGWGALAILFGSLGWQAQRGRPGSRRIDGE